MIQLLIGLVIGILIGWNWTQPPWAKRLQASFVNLVRSSSDKTDH
ncbi:hypothetical protein [Thiocystis violacea]|nr:hypothetical protein [Thiocystis violacea]